MRHLLIILSVALLVACSKREDAIQTPPVTPPTETQPTPDPDKKPTPDPAPGEGGDPAKPGEQPNPEGGDPAPGGEQPTPSTPIRPTEYNMGWRSYAAWRVSADKYYEAFDLEALWLKGNAGTFTARYLAQFVDFFSSDVEGKNYYRFTEADIQQVQIYDIHFDEAHDLITFYTGYNGVRSQKPTSLVFRRADYYARRVSVRKDFAREHYIRGVYEHLGVFAGQMLEFDRKLYVAELIEDSRQISGAENDVLRYRVRLKAQAGDRELATVEVEASGFRSLNTLGKHLVVASTIDLKDKLASYLTRYKEGDVIGPLSYGIGAWIRRAKFDYRGEPLGWSGNVLSTGGGVSEYLDLYLDNPTFELVSAHLSGGDLTLKIRLSQAGGVAISGVELPLIVKGVK